MEITKNTGRRSLVGQFLTCLGLEPWPAYQHDLLHIKCFPGAVRKMTPGRPRKLNLFNGRSGLFWLHFPLCCYGMLSMLNRACALFVVRSEEHTSELQSRPHL